MKHVDSLRLGVNIDHIATIRQARGTDYPNPLTAAQLAKEGGADGITLHIREDKRHMQEHDLQALCQHSPTGYINLEMALTDEMLLMALKYRPQACCIVPEKREELTTEGGLDVLKYHSRICHFVKQLSANDIEVSLFVDPIAEQIEAAKETGAPVVELHTGDYSHHVLGSEDWQEALVRLQEMSQYAYDSGLIVNAGHGLHYDNVVPVGQITTLNELNIGHAIVARALMVGMVSAVQEMVDLLTTARAYTQ